jgi:hypothetical protein
MNRVSTALFGWSFVPGGRRTGMPMTSLFSVLTMSFPFPARSVVDIACFPYQESDRFFLPSIVKRPSATGSELPDVVDAACAATFQQAIDSTVSHGLGGGGLAGVGVPNESRFRYCLSALRRKFKPRACISARSFLLEGRSGSSLSSRTVLLVSRSRNSQLPMPPCGDHTNPLRAGERDAGSSLVSEQPARFSPDHVFPRGYRSY